MKVLYPASHNIPQLNESALALKIARHSHCSTCSSCSGLRPPPGVAVTLDEEDINKSLGALAGYDSDDSDSSAHGYLQSCTCGHEVLHHGADKAAIGADEFARRARVSVRLDEFLQDAGKLLDFDYINEDIMSLRQQMTLPGWSTSDTGAVMPLFLPPTIILKVGRAAYTGSSSGQGLNSPASTLSDPAPLLKRRRISYSSSSSLSNDDEDEDRPLAARIAATAAKSKQSSQAGGVNGKGPGPPRGKKAKGTTAPVSLPVPTDEEKAEMEVPAVNGHEAKVKVEDAMDEGQLNRLVTGVTVDATGSSNTAPPGKPEKIAHAELRRGVIQVVPVENDGKPRSMVILTGLKTLFQKQLPKMPREYIARLVYDENSRSLAIVKRGYKVVGGICFRPFPHRGFAEIVFFATHSVDQVKGYGGMLMDHFKSHIKATYSGMYHFLTYADNYAVGYFRKQGFSKDITLNRADWAGYIKDYEGGTIMECKMVRKVDYLHTRDVIAQQREAILEKIREMSKSHVVYPGLPQFKTDRADVRVNPEDVPGLRESGWTPDMATANARPPARNAEHNEMRRLLADMQGHASGWPFLQPVSAEEVGDYYEVIKQPMDFSTMDNKLETNQYSNLDAFVADAQLIFDNCRSYNPEGTVYAKCAKSMERWLKQQMSDRIKKER